MLLKLPFSNDPAQRFVTQLGERKFVFEAKWNDRSGVWTIDIYDHTTQTALLLGVQLVLGQELLEPYNLGIGRLMVYDEDATGADAGLLDLGDRVNVYWISDDEVLP